MPRPRWVAATPNGPTPPVAGPSRRAHGKRSRHHAERGARMPQVPPPALRRRSPRPSPCPRRAQPWRIVWRPTREVGVLRTQGRLQVGAQRAADGHTGRPHPVPHPRGRCAGGQFPDEIVAGLVLHPAAPLEEGPRPGDVGGDTTPEEVPRATPQLDGGRALAPFSVIKVAPFSLDTRSRWAGATRAARMLPRSPCCCTPIRPATPPSTEATRWDPPVIR